VPNIKIEEMNGIMGKMERAINSKTEFVDAVISGGASED